MDGTILSQGEFSVSTASEGNGHLVVVPSGIDWMRVFNYQSAIVSGNGGAPWYGIDYYWQRGMPNGSAYVSYRGAGISGNTVLNTDVIATGGFTLYDPSGEDPSALPLISNPVVTSATTNAVRPVVSTSNTAGLAVGSVVRLSNTAQSDVNGVDMVVSAVSSGSSFELLFASNELANAPGVVGGAGFYRIINVSALFYPRHRYVTNITNNTAGTAVVSTSVAHGMTPGQEIRFTIPTLSTGAQGMVQMNGVSSVILEVDDDYSFIIDTDTSAFSTFVWPTVSQQPSSFPIMVPYGEDTAVSLISPFSQIPTIGGNQIPNTQSGILADATVNTGVLGMFLGIGALGEVSGEFIIGPGGLSFNPSLIFWTAGKASYGGL